VFQVGARKLTQLPEPQEWSFRYLAIVFDIRLPPMSVCRPRAVCRPNSAWPGNQGLTDRPGWATDSPTRCEKLYVMLPFILNVVAVVRLFVVFRTNLALEILALRQQVAVLKRKRPRPKLHCLDRLFWTVLRRLWSRWAEVLLVVKPETVVGWHRAGFRLYWRWRSRGPAGGRRRLTLEVRELIQRMAQDNTGWGAPKIHGELLKLGFVLLERSVSRYLRAFQRRGDPGKRRLAFLRNHREATWRWTCSACPR
jgi:putative transposase